LHEGICVYIGYSIAIMYLYIDTRCTQVPPHRVQSMMHGNGISAKIANRRPAFRVLIRENCRMGKRRLGSRKPACEKWSVYLTSYRQW